MDMSRLRADCEHPDQVTRRKLGGRRRIHLTAEESSLARVKKKLLSKSSWYKDKKGGKEQKLMERGSRSTKKTDTKGAGSCELKKQKKQSSVICGANSHGGTGKED